MMFRRGKFQNIVKSIELSDGYQQKEPLIVAIRDYFFYLNDFILEKNDKKRTKKFIYNGFLHKIPQLDEIFVNDNNNLCLEILNNLLKYHEEIEDYEKCELIKYIIDLYYDLVDEIEINGDVI